MTQEQLQALIDAAKVIGYVIGGTAAALWMGAKLIERFLPARQLGACPLNADPELRALLTKLTDSQATALNRLSKAADRDAEINATMAKQTEILNELHNDHRIHEMKLDELRRVMG